jgi:uncharacterized protein
MHVREPDNIVHRKIRSLLRRLYRLWSRSERTIRGGITIASATWRVEIAMTLQRRYIGLGGRDELTERTGMLFIYPDAAVREFSMRGCVIPLDIVFLSPSLEVVGVHTMAVESNRAGRIKYAPPVPAQYILEIPAGECSAAGVVVGSKARLTSNIPSTTWSDPC